MGPAVVIPDDRCRICGGAIEDGQGHWIGTEGTRPRREVDQRRCLDVRRPVHDDYRIVEG
jgi:hypothetical protein